jgi:hypothetical protein
MMWRLPIFPDHNVLINHLTRMSRGLICAAGLHRTSPRHIRIISRSRPLTTQSLSQNGGPLQLGRIVALGRMTARPSPPHTEDHAVAPARLRVKGRLAPEDFWAALAEISQTSITGIFGEALQHLGKSRYGSLRGQGRVSLGCLALREPPALRLEEVAGRRQPRLVFTDGQLTVNAPVTDIRCYHLEDFSLNQDAFERMQEHLSRSRGVILSLGLGRPFAATPDREPINWLQVNNIHCREPALW